MKRYLLLLLVLVVVPMMAVNAQSKKKKKNAESPIIEGKQKVRVSDYENVWFFTAFNAKKKYFCSYDYTALVEATQAKKKVDWGNFTPVMNYITTNSRAAATLVAVYALNPNIDDDSLRAQTSREASAEALESLRALEEWMVGQELKNKMVYRTAQVDYRYWLGNDYLNAEPMGTPYKPLGFVIAFTNKKVELFPNAAAGAQAFKDVRFFPNDATVVPSYTPMIDSLASYIMSNDRYEVLLTGYSDNVGTQTYNRALSRQRAVEIKKMLLLRGVPEHRIEVVARGESDPIGDNKTYEGRISNNRVSIKIQ